MHQPKAGARQEKRKVAELLPPNPQHLAGGNLPLQALAQRQQGKSEPFAKLGLGLNLHP